VVKRWCASGIKYANLQYFIKYNFEVLFPRYTYMVARGAVWFYDEVGVLLISILLRL
jgi:hypothetical protein